MILHSNSLQLPETYFPAVPVEQCDNLYSASALVLYPEDINTEGLIDHVTRFNVPMFVVLNSRNSPLVELPSNVVFEVLTAPLTRTDMSRITKAASQFDQHILPPFTRAVAEFATRSRPTFACPGHQGGGCLDLSPIGQRFKQMLGETLFQLDVPHAAPELGDVLGHEGPVQQAEKMAAQVFGAEKTWFVLNGTSTSNKIVTSALIAAGDLVLMDRNNHKSVYLGALILSGGLPVFLENHRDAVGVLGGYKQGTLDESRLRLKAAEIDRERAQRTRPFRLAIVQHATCDGVVLDPAALLRKIGHLCEYILFDSAWLGYENFIETLATKSPLNLKLGPNSPGILVTQSVHKQMSGLSQTSQIHKKDSHIKGQRRYCSARAFNNAFMLHSSTSPFYPLFMSLEINAAIHANGAGKRLWSAAFSLAASLRSDTETQCRTIKPYYGSRRTANPPHGNDEYTALYQKDFIPCFVNSTSSPIEPQLHYLDPCKIIFTTRGTVEAGSEPIPAAVVMQYLRECNFTPEKSDFYNFTLLVSPSSQRADLIRLVTCLKRLEDLISNDAQVKDALPELVAGNHRYQNLSLKGLCKALNDLYEANKIERLQATLFSSQNPIQKSVSSYQANQALVAGRYSEILLANAFGQVAAEGLIPYPPGIMCIAPGEYFNRTILDYLLAIQDISAKFPEFSPHVQGARLKENDDGTISMALLVLE